MAVVSEIHGLQIFTDKDYMSSNTKVEMISFHQEVEENDLLKRKVDKIASDLLRFLNEEEILVKISNANQPGRSSSNVQDSFLDYALSQGFVAEAKGLF